MKCTLILALNAPYDDECTEGDIFLLFVEKYHSFLASSLYVPMRCKVHAYTYNLVLSLDTPKISGEIKCSCFKVKFISLAFSSYVTNHTYLWFLRLSFSCRRFDTCLWMRYKAWIISIIFHLQEGWIFWRQLLRSTLVLSWWIWMRFEFILEMLIDFS